MKQSGGPTVTNEERLRHAGRIPYSTLQGMVGAFFGISVLTVAARMATKIHTRRQLTLDDYLLLLALTCLAGAATLILNFTRIIFIIESLEPDQPASVLFSAQDLSDATIAIAVIDASWCLAWTATVFVKISFLALFRLLIRRISKRITIYYWIVVGFTALSWSFLVSKPFIFCPLFGFDAVPCLSHLRTFLNLTIAATVLDVTTDIMIVSIPILILRKSQMKSTQKLGLGIFLCLSMVMGLIALIRMSVYRRHGNQIDVTWHVCWLFLEACVATIMASITAFRALFVRGGSKGPDAKAQNRLQFYSFRDRVLRKLTRSDKSGSWEEMDQEQLPKIPSATLTGIRTMIHHNGRSTWTETATAPSRDEEDQLQSHELETKRGDGIYVDHSLEIHTERIT